MVEKGYAEDEAEEQQASSPTKKRKLSAADGDDCKSNKAAKKAPPRKPFKPKATVTYSGTHAGIPVFSLKQQQEKRGAVQAAAHCIRPYDRNSLLKRLALSAHEETINSINFVRSFNDSIAIAPGQRAIMDHLFSEAKVTEAYQQKQYEENSEPPSVEGMVQRLAPSTPDRNDILDFRRDYPTHFLEAVDVAGWSGLEQLGEDIQAEMKELQQSFARVDQLPAIVQEGVKKLMAMGEAERTELDEMKL